ncbi:HipA domain-containing protein [Nocardioides sp.]|uniref:type II toxin-antitoxin system HipA family toxin n=1 Tax=Nocardioides sp. TaxID=35761 RepID=UPI00261B80BC|nr:HipA domain-containing protein [Nocardioides sp.]
MSEHSPEAESDLARATSIDRADVYKGGLLAAHLTRTSGDEIEFAYTAQWLAQGGDPVASTLPLSAAPVTTRGGAVPTYFAGLLPEGRRLTALRASVKTSADDELSLVLGIGADTVGDVRVVPEGEPLTAVEPLLTLSSFAQADFSEVLRSIGVRADRVGLAGVQDKVSAAMLTLPVATAGSSFLLKLNPPEFRHLVENEAFFIAAAREAGISTVTADLVHDRAGATGLAVTRFDRLGVDGATTSLAVEDGCQVLDLHPASKYRVSTETLLAALSARCEAPRPAAMEFLAQIAFAYLSGNGDAHAKNFSILRDASGRWQPSPAYDLPSSQVYGDSTMALSLGGRRDGNLSRARFAALGDSLGLGARTIDRTLTRVADSADHWLDGVGLLPFEAGRLTKLKRVIAHRQALLRG